MNKALIAFLLAASMLYGEEGQRGYRDQYKQIRELNHIEFQVGKLQEKVDTINNSIKAAQDAISNLETQLQLQNQSMSIKKRSVRDAFKELVLYSTPERLNFLITADDFESIGRSEAVISRMLRKDLKEYRILEQESQKINTTRELISKEKAKLEEDKKNYALYLDDLKQARDKKKEILEKVKSTNQGYLALAKRLQKGGEKISYFAGGGNKISKTSSAQYQNIFKGLLKPLKGKIIGAFGKLWDPKIKNWIYNKGVTIQADYGREIYSVSDGHVSFSGWILGYGRVLIVKHKDNLFSVYAHLARGLFNTGDTVNKGSIIGLVGDTGSVEQSSLYFELRQDRNNIDPTPLFY